MVAISTGFETIAELDAIVSYLSTYNLEPHWTGGYLNDSAGVAGSNGLLYKWIATDENLNDLTMFAPGEPIATIQPRLFIDNGNGWRLSNSMTGSDGANEEKFALCEDYS